jgi:hypothetical protein
VCVCVRKFVMLLCVYVCVQIKTDDIKWDARTGKIIVEHCRLTPTLCSVLSSIELFVHYNCVLTFHEQTHTQPHTQPHTQTHTADTEDDHTDRVCAITVPAAVYEVDIPTHSYSYDDDEDDVCAHTHGGGGGGGLGKFVSSDIVCADIRVGDILMDTHTHHSSSQQTNTHDTAVSTQTWAAQYVHGRKDKSKSVHTHHHHTHHEHTHDHGDSTNTHTHNNSGVYVVLRVDMLFARVFVQSCEDLPHCWLSAHTHQAGAGDEGEGVNDRQDKCEVDYNVNGTPFWVRYCVVFVRVCVCVCVGVCNAYQLYNFLLFVSWTIAARVCALECDHPPPTLHHTVLCTHTIRVPCTHDHDHDIAVQTVCDSRAGHRRGPRLPQVLTSVCGHTHASWSSH